MKCPHCGTELESDNTCSNCGKQTKDTEKEIEVEYKEFSLSEFLEIRQKQQKNPENGSVVSSLNDSEVLKTDKNGQKKSLKPHKRSFNVFITSLIAIAVIAVFLLLIFLFKK
jgi:hypothetical protein